MREVTRWGSTIGKAAAGSRYRAGEGRWERKVEKIMDIAGRMLETHPEDPGGDLRDKIAACIDACIACAQACTSCADACLAEEDVTPLAECVRLNLDCADLCEVTGRVLSRGPQGQREWLRSLVEACAQVCAACAAECAGHADHHEHCRVCAEACRRCESACRELLAVL